MKLSVGIRKHGFRKWYERELLRSHAHMALTFVCMVGLIGAFEAASEFRSWTDQAFDLLAVDAFSGDSIPVHLLTKEAFELYFRHLKPDGVLAVHITNRYLDLRPVIKTAADHFKRPVRIVDFDGDTARGLFRSRWAIIAADDTFFCHQGFEESKLLADRPGFKAWLDDYSSLFAVLM